ncbi:MAG: hypothetical protein AB7O52_05900 [Planctomycetota bacterium]
MLTASRPSLRNRQWKSGLIILALAAVLAGCHRSSRHHTHVIVDPTPSDFVYEAHVFGADFEDAYVWFNPFDEALVDLSVVDFDGELIVIIEDATGYEIYRDHLLGAGGTIVVKGITRFGIPGDWVIRIIGFDLTGDVALTVYP